MSQSDPKPITILLADDDADDRLLTRDALAESRLANDLRYVEDGEELMQYLRRSGKYADAGAWPRPGLILLDLNMPRKDGREALKEIKSDPSLRHIPIVVVTGSQENLDWLEVACVLRKPVSPERLAAALWDCLGKKPS